MHIGIHWSAGRRSMTTSDVQLKSNHGRKLHVFALPLNPHPCNDGGDTRRIGASQMPNTTTQFYEWRQEDEADVGKRRRGPLATQRYWLCGGVNCSGSQWTGHASWPRGLPHTCPMSSRRAALNAGRGSQLRPTEIRWRSTSFAARRVRKICP